MVAAHMPACAGSMKGNLEADADVVQGVLTESVYKRHQLTSFVC